MKRFLSVCMAACMLSSAASLLPAAGLTVCAEEEGEVLHLIRYSIQNGEVTVTGSDLETGELIIPSEIEGCPVTAIEAHAFSTTRFSKITLPDTLKTIGTDAFYSCTRLESVVIPSGVTEIGFNAFAKCKSLKTVVFSDGVTSVGESAFTDCPALESVSLPEALTTVETLAFSGCKNLKEVSIPAGVTSIGRNAFRGTAWLEAQRAANPLVTVNDILLDAQTAAGNVVIPDSVKTLSPAAFFQASGLKSVVIPDGVTALPEDLFLDCTGLTEIVIPDSGTAFRHHTHRGGCVPEMRKARVCVHSVRRHRHWRRHIPLLQNARNRLRSGYGAVHRQKSVQRM